MRGPETEKSHEARLRAGFYERFMSGNGLDIGPGSAEPVLPTAIGVDKDYPYYDGKNLPFGDESQDYVFASHVLEHIYDPCGAIKEWMRVLRTGGHLVIIVPHQYLYEKKETRPSRWNRDHKRFYEPADLLQEIQDALAPNTWRIRHFRDNDDGYDYSIPPVFHPKGCYEIECVIQKISPPAWELE